MIADKDYIQAITEALLMGTLGIQEHGLPIAPEPDCDAHVRAWRDWSRRTGSRRTGSLSVDGRVVGHVERTSGFPDVLLADDPRQVHPAFLGVTTQDFLDAIGYPQPRDRSQRPAAQPRDRSQRPAAQPRGTRAVHGALRTERLDVQAENGIAEMERRAALRLARTPEDLDAALREQIEASFKEYLGRIADPDTVAEMEIAVDTVLRRAVATVHMREPASFVSLTFTRDGYVSEPNLEPHPKYPLFGENPETGALVPLRLCTHRVRGEE